LFGSRLSRYWYDVYSCVLYSSDFLTFRMPDIQKFLKVRVTMVPSLNISVLFIPSGRSSLKFPM
jgi:hypothetical protein